MQAFWDVIKGRAAQMDGQRGQARFATVTSYDPNTASAKVMLQPDGVLSGWLPVLAAWVGAGWGMHVPLLAGDQVFVLPHEGYANHGVIIGRAYSNVAQPPSVAGADLVLRSSAGACVQLLINGRVVIRDPSGTVLDFTNNGTVTLSGNMAITGDVTLTGTLSVNGAIELNGTVIVAP